MKAKPVWGLAACLLLPLCVGCSADPGVARGQNPAAYSPAAFPSWGTQIGPVHYSPQVISEQNGGQWGSACSNGVCDQGCCRPSAWQPTHYHTFEYKRPKNLVYPPANQPAAIVQYPYYTVKGPSDFFLE